MNKVLNFLRQKKKEKKKNTIDLSIFSFSFCENLIFPEQVHSALHDKSRLLTFADEERHEILLPINYSIYPEEL